MSQPTISRVITRVTPLLGKVLREYVPTSDDLDERSQYIVDGILLPCWSLASHPELYSGKQKTTGMKRAGRPHAHRKPRMDFPTQSTEAVMTRTA